MQKQINENNLNPIQKCIYSLGVDVGTASAAVTALEWVGSETDQNKQMLKDILWMGEMIYDEPVIKGQKSSVTRKAYRRHARSVAKLIQLKRTRLRLLAAILNHFLLGQPNDHRELSFQTADNRCSPELRFKAANDKISKDELLYVLLRIAKNRGAMGGTQMIDDEKEEENAVKRKIHVRDANLLLMAIDAAPDSIRNNDPITTLENFFDKFHQENKTHLDLKYQIESEDNDTSQPFSFKNNNFCNLKVKPKDNKSKGRVTKVLATIDEAKDELGKKVLISNTTSYDEFVEILRSQYNINENDVKTLGGVLLAMKANNFGPRSTFNKTIKDSGKEKYTEKQIISIPRRVIEHEIKTILLVQKQFYPELNYSLPACLVTDGVAAENSELQKIKNQIGYSYTKLPSEVKTISDLILHVVCWQKPISAPNQSGRCRYFPSLPKAPRANPLYQMYRVEKQLLNIRKVIDIADVGTGDVKKTKIFLNDLEIAELKKIFFLEHNMADAPYSKDTIKEINKRIDQKGGITKAGLVEIFNLLAREQNFPEIQDINYTESNRFYVNRTNFILSKSPELFNLWGGLSDNAQRKIIGILSALGASIAVLIEPDWPKRIDLKSCGFVPNTFNKKLTDQQNKDKNLENEQVIAFINAMITSKEKLKFDSLIKMGFDGGLSHSSLKGIQVMLQWLNANLDIKKGMIEKHTQQQIDALVRQFDNRKKQANANNDMIKLKVVETEQQIFINGIEANKIKLYQLLRDSIESVTPEMFMDMIYAPDLEPKDDVTLLPPLLPTGSSVVDKALRVTRIVINQAIKDINHRMGINDQAKFIKPASVVIESTRFSAQGKREKKKAENINTYNAKKKQQALNSLVEKCGEDNFNITEKQILTRVIAEQHDNQCPYCLKNITEDQILNGEIELDHIITKTLTGVKTKQSELIPMHLGCNKGKDNQSLKNFITSKGEKTWTAFEKEIEIFSDKIKIELKETTKKIKNLLAAKKQISYIDDGKIAEYKTILRRCKLMLAGASSKKDAIDLDALSDRAIRQTGWIGHELRRWLSQVIPMDKIHFTNGTFTSELRNTWELYKVIPRIRHESQRDVLLNVRFTTKTTKEDENVNSNNSFGNITEESADININPFHINGNVKPFDLTQLEPVFQFITKNKNKKDNYGSILLKQEHCCFLKGSEKGDSIAKAKSNDVDGKCLFFTSNKELNNALLKEGRCRIEIIGFDKRIDNRHHLIDSLIIAMVSPALFYVHSVNHKNASDAGYVIPYKIPFHSSCSFKSSFLEYVQNYVTHNLDYQKFLPKNKNAGGDFFMGNKSMPKIEWIEDIQDSESPCYVLGDIFASDVVVGIESMIGFNQNKSDSMYREWEVKRPTATGLLWNNAENTLNRSSFVSALKLISNENEKHIRYRGALKFGHAETAKKSTKSTGCIEVVKKIKKPNQLILNKINPLIKLIYNNRLKTFNHDIAARFDIVRPVITKNKPLNYAISVNPDNDKLLVNVYVVQLRISDSNSMITWSCNSDNYKLRNNFDAFINKDKASMKSKSIRRGNAIHTDEGAILITKILTTNNKKTAIKVTDINETRDYELLTKVPGFYGGKSAMKKLFTDLSELVINHDGT